ncbi:Dihydropteroate synthase [Chlamydiales bacterium SCGC AB-751-O23]|jgi:dihydropteroate synthase|nr:Dihydropteroate synthase [Chlamydiales bacterium SCGC AB-751-O23]
MPTLYKETPEKQAKTNPLKASILMGILNVTPDSFYDGGSYYHLSDAITRAAQLELDGASIIDVGGVSSRPNASAVPEEEEFNRVIPVIKELSKKTTLPISVDTHRASIAKEAIKAGATIINDVSGFKSILMQKVAAEHQVDICLMHRQGTPLTMQINPSYRKGVVPSLMKWFDKKISELLNAGVKEEKIILDPGIGFGKTVEQNIEILKNISCFKSFGLRLLVGISRKSFISKITGKPSQHLLPPTLALNTLLIQEGVDILRVHDIYEHNLILQTLQAYAQPNKN